MWSSHTVFHGAGPRAAGGGAGVWPATVDAGAAATSARLLINWRRVTLPSSKSFSMPSMMCSTVNPARRAGSRCERVLARHALVVVLRAELLEERHGRGERRDALHRLVRHVARGPDAVGDRGHGGARGDEIADHL